VKSRWGAMHSDVLNLESQGSAQAALLHEPGLNRAVMVHAIWAKATDGLLSKWRRGAQTCAASMFGKIGRATIWHPDCPLLQRNG
jgi:hypothetical protein